MMAGCPVIDCPALWRSPPELLPNPDVAGIGVLVGFFVTAFITLGLMILHYVLVFDPERDGLTGKGSTHPNPVDRLLLKWVSTKLSRPSKTWEKAIEKVILTVSDQQMITGIALLLSAYLQLDCGIAAYHWQIMVYLAWFSSFTHLATLTVLRRYFNENRSVRWWRLPIMFIMIAILAAALIPTGNDNWLLSTALDGSSREYIGMPAKCSFHISTDLGIQLSSMIISVFFIITSYLTRFIKLFESTSTSARLFLRIKPGNGIKILLGKLDQGIRDTLSHKWIISIPYWSVLTMLLSARAWYDVMESMFWEIIWLVIALIWGSLRLFSTRDLATLPEENTWGFGQCLATAMVFLLLFTGVEAYNAWHQSETSSRTLSTQEHNSRTEAMLGSTASSGTAEIPTTEENVGETVPRSNSVPTQTDAEEDLASLSFGRSGRDIPLQLLNRSTATMASEETAMGEMPLRRTGTDIPPQPQLLNRSTTTLSGEERDIGGGMPQRRVQRQQTQRMITGQTSPSFSSATNNSHRGIPPSNLRSVPHQQDFYEYTWFRELIVFIFLQLMLFSGYLLSGAYGSGSLIDLRNPLAVLQNVFSWVTFYGPLGILLYVSLLLFLQVSRTWSWPSWSLLSQIREIDKEGINYGRISLISGLLGDSGYTLLLRGTVPWESVLPLGDYFTVYPAGVLFAVAVPWSIVVYLRLQSNDRQS